MSQTYGWTEQRIKLRFILLLLCFMTVASASAGGYFYYTSLKNKILKEVETTSPTRAEMLSKTVSFYLTENVRPVKTLAGVKEISHSLRYPSESALEAVNSVLDLFADTLNTDVCYLLDRTGNTIASSNRYAPDSFVGNNFAFRPYFQKAITGTPATYMALGKASGKRGVYFSHPVYASPSEAPLGVVVIKSSIDLIEKELSLSEDEILLCADPHGIIFISTFPEWLFHSLDELSPEQTELIAKSLQFGNGPWRWSGLKLADAAVASDVRGNRYLMHRFNLDAYDGWQMIYLLNQSAVSKRISKSYTHLVGIVILMLCLMIGVTVFAFYWLASREILRRKAVENDLRRQEERYRFIYHNAPAMLHSVDKNGCLIDVSDHWLKALGYRRHDVIGKKLSVFLSPESGRYADEVMIPKFFNTGWVADVPYQFVKKNGETMDVLLSAVGERDADGSVVRSLTVSIDVTERKRAEQALKEATDKLSRYSKELERLVRLRTQEITNILKYTPDVVYIKDIQGCYLLVNPKFEELFGVKNEQIRGKTSQECILANPFQIGDEKVLELQKPCDGEFQIHQKDGIHTYFCVTFPIYDDAGAISGVGGIAADITPLKKAEEQLRRISASLIESQEKERASIARELHDELGQMLTALRMDAVWIRRRLTESDPKTAMRAAILCDMIDKTIEDVRNIAIRLRPGVLDTLGLTDALEWYAAEFEKRHSILCIFKHDSIPTVSSAIATAAYRIAQESLTNAARHSSAARVDMTLNYQDKVLCLTIADDGCGFDPEVLTESQQIGIAGMKERAMLAGGDLTIESMPGNGTRVSFRVRLTGDLYDHRSSCR